ncbi:hypothetical protein OH492_16245 [Vibrio chagasii]|nr:hypothetical protein [Vibrio chagasii]
MERQLLVWHLLARHVTNNFVVSLWDSFHGARHWTHLQWGGEASAREGMGPLMAGVERIPPAVLIAWRFPRLKEVVQAIARDGM